MSDPIFKFTMRSAAADPTGYFITRWDLCQRLTVFARTRSEALDKAQLALGGPRAGKVWSHEIDSIEEVERLRALATVDDAMVERAMVAFQQKRWHANMAGDALRADLTAALEAALGVES